MSPSPKAATELKKLQSSLYTYLATILRVQKIYIRGYHDMLAGLAQCLAYQKSATEPTHVRNLQLMQTHYTIVMKELEDKMADSMQTVRVLRNANADAEEAFEKIQRLERMLVAGKGRRRSARIRERRDRLVAAEVAG